MKPNPALKDLGPVTLMDPDPGPEIEEITASGVLDYYNLPQVALSPSAKLGFLVPLVAPLVALISADQYFSLVLADAATGSPTKYVQLLGSKVDRMRFNADNPGTPKIEWDVESLDTNVNAPTLGSGGFTTPGNLYTDNLTSKNLTLSKNGSTISDWEKSSFTIENNLDKERRNPSTGKRRALPRTNRTNEWSYTRDVLTGDTFDEYSAKIAGTPFTSLKFLLTNLSGGLMWSVTFNNCMYKKGGKHDLAGINKSALTKELRGSGKTLTYGTS